MEAAKHIVALQDWEEESKSALDILRMKTIESDHDPKTVQDLLVRLANHVSLPPQEMLPKQSAIPEGDSPVELEAKCQVGLVTNDE